MTELIRVDFRTRNIKSRQQIGPGQEPYNPYKDEAFKQYTSALGDLATVAHQAGVDVKRMVTIIDDPDTATAMFVYDHDVMSPQEVMNALACASLRIEASLNDGPGTA